MHESKKHLGKLVSFVYKNPEDIDEIHIGILKHAGNFSIEMHNVVICSPNEDVLSNGRYAPVRNYNVRRIKDNCVKPLTEEDSLAKQYREVINKSRYTS